VSAAGAQLQRQGRGRDQGDDGETHAAADGGAIREARHG
jgi:hypothetical protein